jgi:hypothetical protein
MFKCNPKDKTEGGGSAQAGTYPYVVDHITEKTFNSGNDGWKVELMVGAFPDRDIRVFCNLVNVPSALFMMEQFCNAHGVDFNSGEYDPTDFEGRSGKAAFVKNEKGYLDVKTFLAASANNGPDARKAAPARKPVSNEPPPPSDDDCPPF